MDEERRADAMTEEYPLLGPLREALSASPEWWGALFEAAGIGMAIVTPQRAIIGITPSLAEMLGYSRREILDRGVAGIVHPDDLTSDEELFADLVAGRRSSYRFEKRYVRADGAIMWGRLTMLSLSSPGGEGRWLVGMVQDITARKDAEARLRRFIAEASHELRTPVAVIDGAVQMIVDEEDPSARRGLLQMLQRQSQHLSRLLDRMLDLSRLEGDTYAEARPFVLLEEVEAAVAQLRPDQPVDVEVPASLVVVGDPLSTRQVVTNLVTNAISYGDPPIRIRARYEHPTVVLEVRDHGQGLSHDTLRELFQPFATGAEGVGLGLAIVRATVEAMGGMVWYEQADPGARFCVRLPTPAAAGNGEGPTAA